MKRRKFLATTTGAISASSILGNIPIKSTATVSFNTSNSWFSETDVTTNNFVVSFSDITITTENIQNIQEDLRFEVQIYTDIIDDYKTIDTAKLNIDSGSTKIDIGSLSYDLANYSLNIKDASTVRTLIKVNHPDITADTHQIVLIESASWLISSWKKGLLAPGSDGFAEATVTEGTIADNGYKWRCHADPGNGDYAYAMPYAEVDASEITRAEIDIGYSDRNGTVDVRQGIIWIPDTTKFSDVASIGQTLDSTAALNSDITLSGDMTNISGTGLLAVGVWSTEPADDGTVEITDIRIE